MPVWEYCSIRTIRKIKFFAQDFEFVLEHWAPDGNHATTTVASLPPAIARLGVDGWELIDYWIAGIQTGDISHAHWGGLLKRPRSEESEEKASMEKWQYCDIHWKWEARGLTEKASLVVEHWNPDGVSETACDLPDVHAAAAQLAREGWEIVQWFPPTPYSKKAKQSGRALMKRAIPGE
jgi:hypothetical protein